MSVFLKCFKNCELIDFGRLISTNLFTVSRHKYVKNKSRSIEIYHSGSNVGTPLCLSLNITPGDRMGYSLPPPHR